MKLVVKSIDTKGTRWITPFPETYPGFKVEMRNTNRSELSKVLHKHGLTPHKRVAKDFETVYAMDRDLFKLQFVSAQGEAEVFGVDLADENREKVYIDSQLLRPPLPTELGPACSNCGTQDHVPENGEVRESIWSFISRTAENEEAIDLKN